ncbi:MAG: hypothetical protein R6U69_06300 [Marinobacter sp.]
METEIAPLDMLINNFYLAGMVTVIALVIMIVFGRFERELVPEENQ